MGGGQAFDPALVVDEVDAARVGDVRYRQICNRGQRFLVFEGARQHGAYLRENSRVALAALSIADVAGDFRGADHVAALVANRRDRQRHVHERAVLVAADRFEVLDGQTLTDLLVHDIFLVLAFVRKDRDDGAADHFGLAEAVEALGGTIPRRHRAIEVRADNRVVRRLHDRRESRGAGSDVARRHSG